MATTKSTTATKKDTTAPVKKSPAAKPATKTPAAKTPAAKPATTAAKPVEKKPVPKPKKPVDMSKMSVKTPTTERSGATKTSTGKTVYHVSKRDNDGREWKVFIQGSDKVIKLFKTQAEALEYAKSLAKNKDDGSYVVLHSLDGKIRKY